MLRGLMIGADAVISRREYSLTHAVATHAGGRTGVLGDRDDRVDDSGLLLGRFRGHEPRRTARWPARPGWPGQQRSPPDGTIAHTTAFRQRHEPNP